MRYMLRKSGLSLLVMLITLLFSNSNIYGQLPGLPPVDPSDTTMIFSSPRPLISDTNIFRARKQGFAGELYLSTHGFGFGFGYQWALNEQLVVSITLAGSGARNSDEFEVFDRTGIYVPNKVNRLLMFPLLIGTRYRLFKDDITESLRPHVSAAFGGTFIMEGPYQGHEQNFFGSLPDARWYTRPGGYLGIGANIGNFGGGSALGVEIRYYSIPFGGKGLESIKDLPIDNFGGIFLCLNFGVIN
ncbi:MAG: hypothetical protein ACK6DA_12935 [Candidatus Kapaibacterium sp.]